MHQVQRIISIVCSILFCISGCKESRTPRQPTAVVITTPPHTAMRPRAAKAQVDVSHGTSDPPQESIITCAWIVDGDLNAYENEPLALNAARHLGKKPSDVSHACAQCPFEDCP